MLRTLSDFAHNLGLGARLALFRKVAVREFIANADQVLLFFGLSLLVYLLRDLINEGIPGEFNLRAIPQLLFADAVLLGLIYLLCRWLQQTRISFALFIAVQALVLWYGLSIIVMYALKRFLDLDQARAARIDQIAVAIDFVTALAIIVAMLRLSGGAWFKRALAGFAMVALPLIYFYSMGDEPVWVATGETVEQLEDPAILEEATLQAQAHLLDEELAALAAQRPHVHDLYFVGFGAYAEENVFMLEINTIRELFDERFDTNERSVALINNNRTAQEVPLATLSNLDKTLEHLGEIMDTQHDVLFLYLTTHGSEQHELSVSYEPLKLDQLDPAKLAKLLRDSGIKWKVIAVSACYSGGFIEPLKDDHTMIVTASDADRTSFGCGTESEFTYFGKAYFDHALRKTFSFTQAFEQAKLEIAAREKTEQNGEHSKPQIFVGAQIAAKLPQLEQRLQQLAAQQTQVGALRSPTPADLPEAEGRLGRN